MGDDIIPISSAGASLLWKKVQKKEMKKNTSDTINRIIPHRSPVVIELCDDLGRYLLGKYLIIIGLLLV